MLDLQQSDSENGSVNGAETGDKICFEFCYEVIHKVGGIETVIRMKAPAMTHYYGDNFFMVGPYFGWDDYSTFEEFHLSEEEKQTSFIYKVISTFERTYGVSGVKFGRWLIAGNPQVILLPLMYNPSTEFESQLHRAESTLYSACNISFPKPAYGEREPFTWNALVFGAMGWCFLSTFMSLFSVEFDASVVVHTHEWLAAITQILYKKQGNSKRDLSVTPRPGVTLAHGSAPERIAFLFTTHATTIGRHLSAGDICLNDCINSCKDKSPDENAAHWDWEARNRSILIEHRVERAAVHTCEVFTTVSDITGREAELFLGRRPDVLTYNGMDISSQQRKYTSEAAATHDFYKEKIHEFCRGHFNGLELRRDDTLVFFSAGRLEYKNKGYDLFLDALAALNDRLKHDYALAPYRHINIVGIIIAPSRVSHYHIETMKGVNLMREIRDTVQNVSAHFSERLVDLICSKTFVGAGAGAEAHSWNSTMLHDMLHSDDFVQLKRLCQSYNARTTLPPIITHSLLTPEQDTKEPILCKLREIGLVNQADNPVKVLWIPEFVKKSSPVAMDYSEFTYGASLGVFCSLYEPWGYTSPECACVGTPSVVSNLCGFGNFMETMMQRARHAGKAGENVVEYSEVVHRSASIANLVNTEQSDNSTPDITGHLSTKSGMSGSRKKEKILNRMRVDTMIKEHNENIWNRSCFGVEVVDRVFKTYHETVMQLVACFVDFIKLTREERQALRNKTSRSSVLSDWSVLIGRYIEAHKLAESRISK